MFSNKVFLKNLLSLSAILGLILGIITIIPFISGLAFFVLMVLAAPILFVYLKKLQLIGYMTPQEGAIYGSFIGFASFLGFSVSFIPLATIIGFIYKGSFYLGIKMLFESGIVLILTMVIFVAILSALMNAFSGLVTMYIYNQIEEKPKEEHTNIDINE